MRECLYFLIELKAVGEFEKDWIDNRDKLDKRLNTRGFPQKRDHEFTVTANCEVVSLSIQKFSLTEGLRF